MCFLSQTADPPPAEATGEVAAEGEEGNVDGTSVGGKTQEGDEGSDDDKSSVAIRVEVPIDANHPEVVKIVNEAMVEAEKREPELSPDEYTDVIEEAVQKRYAELQELNPDGPQ